MKTGNGFRTRVAGFSYMGLLLAIAGAALAVSAGSHLLGNEIRRDREEELLAAGDEIRRAIEAYHSKNNGGGNPFPRQLEWLLKDPNQPTTQRYLRRLSRDPMGVREGGKSGDPLPWAVILDVNGQIVGVHSTSTREPLKTGNFPKVYENFREAKRYSDWRFIAAGGVPANPGTPAGGAARNFIPGSSASTLSPSPVGAASAGTLAPAFAAPAAIAVPSAPSSAGAGVETSRTRSPVAPAAIPVEAAPVSVSGEAASSAPSAGAPTSASGASASDTVPAPAASTAGSAASPATGRGSPSGNDGNAAVSAPSGTAIPDSFTSTPQPFVIRPQSGF